MVFHASTIDTLRSNDTPADVKDQSTRRIPRRHSTSKVMQASWTTQKKTAGKKRFMWTEADNIVLLEYLKGIHAYLRTPSSGFKTAAWHDAADHCQKKLKRSDTELLTHKGCKSHYQTLSIIYHTIRTARNKPGWENAYTLEDGFKSISDSTFFKYASSLSGELGNILLRFRQRGWPLYTLMSDLDRSGNKVFGALPANATVEEHEDHEHRDAPFLEADEEANSEQDAEQSAPTIGSPTLSRHTNKRSHHVQGARSTKRPRFTSAVSGNSIVASRSSFDWEDRSHVHVHYIITAEWQEQQEAIRCLSRLQEAGKLSFDQWYEALNILSEIARCVATLAKGNKDDIACQVVIRHLHDRETDLAQIGTSNVVDRYSRAHTGVTRHPL